MEEVMAGGVSGKSSDVDMFSSPRGGDCDEKIDTPPKKLSLTQGASLEGVNQPPGSQLPKLDVEGSSPFARFLFPSRKNFISLTVEESSLYHTWPEPSCSDLKLLDESPVAYYERKVAKTAPPRSGEALSYGTLLHSWAEIGDEAFWKRAVICPDQYATSTGLWGKAADAWARELPPDALPLAPADGHKLRAQTLQVLANPAAKKLLSQAIIKEHNVRWRWNGHSVRCRFDGATDDCWWDVKTTRDQKPLEQFWQSVKSYRYDMQAAMYESAMLACGWDYHPLVFIATSTTYPHHCSVVTLPPAVTQRGRERCLRLLDELETRRDYDHWLPNDYGQILELPCPRFFKER
jgi:hypothetical protein